jgi:hypothetical protein
MFAKMQWFQRVSAMEESLFPFQRSIPHRCCEGFVALWVWRALPNFKPKSTSFRDSRAK